MKLTSEFDIHQNEIMKSLLPVWWYLIKCAFIDVDVVDMQRRLFFLHWMHTDFLQYQLYINLCKCMWSDDRSRGTHLFIGLNNSKIEHYKNNKTLTVSEL